MASWQPSKTATCKSYHFSSLTQIPFQVSRVSNHFFPHTTRGITLRVQLRVFKSEDNPHGLQRSPLYACPRLSIVGKIVKLSSHWEYVFWPNHE
jgi:hypothetical protein